MNLQSAEIGHVLVVKVRKASSTPELLTATLRLSISCRSAHGKVVEKTSRALTGGVEELEWKDPFVLCFYGEDQPSTLFATIELSNDSNPHIVKADSVPFQLAMEIHSPRMYDIETKKCAFDGMSDVRIKLVVETSIYSLSPPRFEITSQAYTRPNQSTQKDSIVNYGAIFNALLTLGAENFIGSVPDFLLEDILHDAHELVETYITKSTSLSVDGEEAISAAPTAYLPRQFFCGQKYSFSVDRFSRYNPIEHNSLRIILGDRDAEYLSLTFPNRYAVWMCFCVLKDMIGRWNEDASTTRTLKPVSTLSNKINVNSATITAWFSSGGWKVTLLDQTTSATTGVSVEGVLRIDPAVPHRLYVGARSFNIEHTTSLVLPIDAHADTSRTIALSVQSLLSDDWDRHSDDEEGSHTDHSLLSSFRPSVMASAVAHLAEDITMTAANKASSVVKSTAKGIGSLASAINRGGSSAALEPGSTANSVSIVRSMLEEGKTFVLMKYLGSSQVVDLTPLLAKKAHDRAEVDVLLLDFFVATTKMMASSIRFPYERCDVLLFLYRGLARDRTQPPSAAPPQPINAIPIRAKILEYEALEGVCSGASRHTVTGSADEADAEATSSSSSEPFTHEDRVATLFKTFTQPAGGEKQNMEVTWAERIDMVLGVVRVENLAFQLPNARLPLSTSNNNLSGANKNENVVIVAHIRLLDAARAVLRSSDASGVNTSTDSSSATLSTYPSDYNSEQELAEWDNVSLLLPLLEFVEHVRYVRVELVAVHRSVFGTKKNNPLTPHETSLGAIFIPLAAFTHHEKELVFPLEDFRHKRLCRPAQQSGPKFASAVQGAPMMTVTLQVIEHKRLPAASLNATSLVRAPSRAPGGSVLKRRDSTLPITSSLRVSSIGFNIGRAWYPGDSVLVGDVATQEESRIAGEAVHVHCGRQALIIRFANPLSARIPADAIKQAVGAEGGTTAAAVAWRAAVLEIEPKALLRVCEDATAADAGYLRVPYNTVTAMEIVTPAILCLTIDIHRFIYDARQRVGRFVGVAVQVFVYNCKSKDLSVLLEDRRYFTNLRKDFLAVFSPQIRVGTSSRVNSGRSSPVGDAPGISQGRCTASDALVLAVELDALAKKCQRDLSKMQRDNPGFWSNSSSEHWPLPNSNHNQLPQPPLPRMPRPMWRDLRLLGGRACRLKLYEAALYGIGLQSDHQFTPSRVFEVIQDDLQEILLPFSAYMTPAKPVASMPGATAAKSSDKTLLDPDFFVATSQTLLYRAEQRLREAALAGWSRRGTGFETTLLQFVDRYFRAWLDMVRALYSDGGFQQIKGLHGKQTVLLYLMHNHERFHEVLVSSLRPYQLQVLPEARLFSCVSRDALVSWYHTAITREMFVRWKNVLVVWEQSIHSASAWSAVAGGSQTVTPVSTARAGVKNAVSSPTATAATSSVVPWIPQRDGASGMFLSRIPEDLVSVLVVYLQHSVLPLDELPTADQTAVATYSAETILHSFFHVFGALAWAYSHVILGYDLPIATLDALCEDPTSLILINQLHNEVSVVEPAVTSGAAAQSTDASSTESTAMPPHAPVTTTTPLSPSVDKTTTSSTADDTAASSPSAFVPFHPVANLRRIGQHMSRQVSKQSSSSSAATSTTPASKSIPATGTAGSAVSSPPPAAAPSINSATAATLPGEALLQTDEKVAEYSTWLCSVANDAMRILNRRLLEREVPEELWVRVSSALDGGDVTPQSSAKDESGQVQGLPAALLDDMTCVYGAFDHVVERSLEQLATIAFHCVCQERGISHLEDVITACLDSAAASSTDGGGNNAPQMIVLAHDVKSCLEDFAPFLHPNGFVEYLLPSCLRRLGQYLLSLLRALRNKGMTLVSHPCLRDLLEGEVTAMEEMIIDAKLTVFGDDEAAEQQRQQLDDAFAGVSVLLSMVRALILDDIHAKTFIGSLKDLSATAHTAPDHANVVLRMLKVALSVRGHSKYFTRAVRMKNAVKRVRVASPTSLNPVATAAAAASAASAALAAAVGTGIVDEDEFDSGSVDGNYSREPTPPPAGEPASAAENAPAGHDDDHAAAPVPHRASFTTYLFARRRSSSHDEKDQSSGFRHSTGSAKHPAPAPTPASARYRPGKLLFRAVHRLMKSSRSPSPVSTPTVNETSSTPPLPAATESTKTEDSERSSDHRMYAEEMVALRDKVQWEWIDQTVSDVAHCADDFQLRPNATTEGAANNRSFFRMPGTASTEPQMLPTRPTRAEPVLHFRLARRLVRRLQTARGRTRNLLQHAASRAVSSVQELGSHLASTRAGHVHMPADAARLQQQQQHAQDLYLELFHATLDSILFDSRLQNIFFSATDRARKQPLFATLTTLPVLQKPLSVVQRPVQQVAATAAGLSKAALSVATSAASVAVEARPAALGWRLLHQLSSVVSDHLQQLKQAASERALVSSIVAAQDSALSARSSESDQSRPPTLSRVPSLSEADFAVLSSMQAVQHLVRVSQVRVWGTFRFALLSEPRFMLRFKLHNGISWVSSAVSPVKITAETANVVTKVGHDSVMYVFPDPLESHAPLAFSTGGEALSLMDSGETGSSDDVPPALTITLLDAGVLVDQTLATLTLPLCVDAEKSRYLQLTAEEVLPFQTFASTLRVQRALQLAHQRGGVSVPRISFSLSVT